MSVPTPWHQAMFGTVDHNDKVQADRVKGATQWAEQPFTSSAERSAKDAMLETDTTQAQLNAAADLAAGVAPGPGLGRALKPGDAVHGLPPISGSFD